MSVSRQRPAAAKHPLRKHVIVVLAMGALDFFVIGQGAFPILIAVAMFFVGFAHIVRGLLGDTQRILRGLCVWGLYAGMVLVCMLGIRSNASLAERRANRVVAALQAYDRDHGDFPETLEALKPRYLPEIPNAKWSLYSSKFDYYYEPARRRGFLAYTTIPPFGRRAYFLDDRRWHSFD